MPASPLLVSLSDRWSSLEIDHQLVCYLLRGLLARQWRLTPRFFLGTLFRASQFLSEELPIRLAHRVQDLGELPDGLSEMPSIKKVQDWYAQSFEV